MDRKQNGLQLSSTDPTEYLTGSVRVEPLFEARRPSRARGGSVIFEPGARSVWSTHPLGQVLTVTSGVGPIQWWGERPYRSGRAMLSGVLSRKSAGTAPKAPTGKAPATGASDKTRLPTLVRLAHQRATAVDGRAARSREDATSSSSRTHPVTGPMVASVPRTFNYCAVPTNIMALATFPYAVTQHWYRSLPRRSQRCAAELDIWATPTAPRVQILHPWSGHHLTLVPAASGRCGNPARPDLYGRWLERAPKTQRKPIHRRSSRFSDFA